MKTRLLAIFLILIGGGIGYFNYDSQINPESNFPFKLGLDLAGGTHLVYRADVSKIEPTEVHSSMSSLRDVIERRTNLFGVSEPMVQVEKSGVFSGVEEQRLIVELPGVTDINKAVELIGQTPLLEFKKERPGTETQDILNAQQAFAEFSTSVNTSGNATITPDPDSLASKDPFIDTGLTGRFLEKSQVQFDPTTGEAAVLLAFNKEGKELFAEITEENIGKVIAIYLDGVIITAPVVNETIRDGRAQISGGFTAEEAKLLVRDLNYGALPVPIELISTQSIGASLGADVLHKGVNAGIYGLVVVAIFLLLWYRLLGLLSIISLAFYVAIILAIYKVVPVTLTSAGIAGFILSIGMAVDANILVFERIKEELKSGRDIESSIKEGFARAWLSIRDSNISSIITAIILFWFGTSLIEGFALTFGLGVIVSMFTAITVTKNLLLAVAPKSDGKVAKFLFGSGVRVSKN